MSWHSERKDSGSRWGSSANLNASRMGTPKRTQCDGGGHVMRGSNTTNRSNTKQCIVFPHFPCKYTVKSWKHSWRFFFANQPQWSFECCPNGCRQRRCKSYWGGLDAKRQQVWCNFQVWYAVFLFQVWPLEFCNGNRVSRRLWVVCRLESIYLWFCISFVLSVL